MNIDKKLSRFVVIGGGVVSLFRFFFLTEGEHHWPATGHDPMNMPV